jgi:hypothetical protein
MRQRVLQRTLAISYTQMARAHSCLFGNHAFLVNAVMPQVRCALPSCAANECAPDASASCPISDVRERDRQRRAAERLDQARVLSVKVTHLVDDAWAVLLSMGGDFLNLLWGYLACLLRRDRTRHRPSTLPENPGEGSAAGQGCNSCRAEAPQQLVQHPGLLLGIRL